MHKREYGIYNTMNNPFNMFPFSDWREAIEQITGQPFYNSTFLEPFAGSNNIIEMIQPVGPKLDWECYDINPNNGDANTSGIMVEERDTLKDWPKCDGITVVITNPPYLAKNVAKKLGLYYPEEAEQFPDLYLYCLEVMLKNVNYAAVILPDSFIQKIRLFRTHIFSIDRQTKILFEDTDEPVCVVYFIKDCNTDFIVYADGNPVKKYSELCNDELNVDNLIDVSFNSPNGEVGLVAFDDTKTATIRFVLGEMLANRKIGNSSRHYTRISGISKYTRNINGVIAAANNILDNYRNRTDDFFLTAFKGMRKDGKLRRRLDYKKVRMILTLAVQNVMEKK